MKMAVPQAKENPKSDSGCLGAIRGYFERMKKARKLLHTRYRINDLERAT